VVSGSEMSSQQARPALFPVSRRVSQVRAAAETLYNTHGEAAATYWKAAIRSIADPLFAIGWPEERVRAEILSFQESVQLEMQKFG
jgi:hypothetical protein